MKADEYIFRHGLRVISVEEEPAKVYLCHLPSDQCPEPYRGLDGMVGMQLLDKGHDWNWRDGSFRISLADYKDDDVVRLYLQYETSYDHSGLTHCGFEHPADANFCCKCGALLYEG